MKVRKSAQRSAGMTLVGLALALTLVGCQRGGAPEEETPSWQALYDAWVYPQPLPDFRLVNQEGRPVSIAGLTQGYLLIGFIFTRCKVGEACPLTTTKMARVLELWKAARGASSPPSDIPPLHLLSLTLDPAWDTPERLKGYAAARGADLTHWTFATGPAKLMTDGLPSLFNVLALPSAEAGITHTVKVALLRPDRTSVAEWKDDAFDPQIVMDRMLADAGAASERGK